VESLLGEAVVSSPATKVPVRTAITLIRLLDLPQNFTGVSGRRFPRS
jgi:hypothetical protein